MASAARSRVEQVMKVIMTVKITVEVDDPDGYPDEYNAVQEYAHIEGDKKSKRERHVLASHAVAVRGARGSVYALLEELDLDIEMVDGKVG